MCIVALAWQLFDHLPLLLLSNRDEVLSRPTRTPHTWTDMPIYAGRDEQSGGTWLGISTDNQRWAVVLNFRDGIQAHPEQHSRGQLVTQFLNSQITPLAFARQLNLSAYAGFNLLIGNHLQAVLINNRGYPPTPLHAGLHVLSNGQPDSEWFKCQRLRQRVSQEVLPLIAQHTATSDWHKAAFNVLSDTTPAPKDCLPNTGLGQALEYHLSPICINTPKLTNYGTRSQSIVSMLTGTDGSQLNLLSREYTTTAR